MPLRESVRYHLFNQFNRLPSWDPNQGDFLVIVFAFLSGRRLCVDITGLFLGAGNLTHIRHPHFGLRKKLKVN